ncbi:hypothetical protein SDC9_199998 [bioreactor metagenome]|uniref:Uncharacterized protein n=1 Tax=bioreactor metagenome TaxID=1076179 RepID=A0A645INB2_9ZZZZ
MFNPVELPQNPLQRTGDQLFDFARRMPRIGHLDIGHRDDDLGILLAGRQPQRRRSQQHRGDDQHRGKRSVQKESDDAHNHGETSFGFR